MAVPGRIFAGRAGPVESAWPHETKVRTKCLLGSAKHPSRSATGRVLSPQSRWPAEHRSTPAGCVMTPKPKGVVRPRHAEPARRETRAASSRFMGSACEGTAIGSSPNRQNCCFNTLNDLNELRRSPRSHLFRLAKRSVSLSLYRAVRRKETKRKLLSWGNTFVSVRSVNVDDKLVCYDGESSGTRVLEHGHAKAILHPGE
jgi:hypothetical protein